jgi:hypothetical protein
MNKKSKSKKRAKRETAQVFDLLFKQLLHLSDRAVVSFINGLFGTKHPPDSHVTHLGTETVSKEFRHLLRDTVLMINGVTYHVEAEIDFGGDMAIRVFEYGLAYGIWKKTGDSNVRTIEFPQARIIFWELDKRMPKKQILRLKFPNGKCYDYEVETFNLLSYSVEELEEKGLAILIPFYVLKMRKRVEAAKSGAALRKLTKPMAELLDSLSEAVDHCTEKGVIEATDVRDIVCSLERLYKELFSQYDELAKDDVMLKKYLFEPTANILEKEVIKIAKNFLALGDSPEKVAKATELPLAKVESLLKRLKVKQSA